MPLNSSVEIKAWIEERKKRFPTQARVAEKAALKEKQQEAKRLKNLARQQEQEQRQQQNSVKSGDKKRKHDRQASAPDGPNKTPEDEQQRQRRKLEKTLRKAEKLRAKLLEVGTEKLRVSLFNPEVEKSESVDAKDSNVSQPAEAGVQAKENPDAEIKPVTKAEDVSMSSDSEESSSSSEDSSNSDLDADGDKAPEAQSTKKPQQKVKAGKSFTNIPCKYFIRDGSCRRKDCRFLHHIPKQKGKSTLYGRVCQTNLCQ